jgi:hypothetical protein
VQYNATLVGLVEVAPGLDIMRVAPDTQPFEFTSGQYVVLGIKAGAARVAEAEPESPSVVSDGSRDASPASRAALDAQAASASQVFRRSGPDDPAGFLHYLGKQARRLS